MINESINIAIGSVELTAIVSIPDNALGLVIMGNAHESGLLHDKLLNEELKKNQIATLSVDLLTSEEGVGDQKPYNIELLTERLIAVTHWLQMQPLTAALSLGYYGSGLEAATALRAASGLLHQIKAVVICEGDVSQAMYVLHQINAPTLLMTGSTNPLTIETYQEAIDKITTEKNLIILGDDPTQNTAEKVSLALDWFSEHFKVIA